MHVWELFNDYYMLKRGREYNAAPARKLSEAFGLELSGGSAVTAKQVDNMVYCLRFILQSIIYIYIIFRYIFIYIFIFYNYLVSQFRDLKSPAKESQ